ncbi:MAG TPA: chemotaxis-specific protein-glutamate methyltransferase CheB [Polyangiaceae bacterium]|nr:chemotaxis-specific protein-glutamate methyltransferase CheB [Polyangiaceae bacterium]
MERIRVLVVDDSAFARKVMREVLGRSPQLEVVGTARDGLEALEKIEQLKPDVVTLDLIMPNLDGLGVLAELPSGSGPRVVIVSMAGEESELAIRALQAGALDVVHKPTALASGRLYELSDELIAKILTAAAARPLTRVPAAEPLLAASVALRQPLQTERTLLVVGASTGGPQAITRLLKAFPATFPVPIAIVVHIPVGFTASLAQRLDAECALHVVEARAELQLRPGLVVIAQAGIHLKLRRDGQHLRCDLDLAPLSTLHRPAVDVLFQSAALACGAGVMAVVLTGMGDDGLVGARAVHEAGGILLTEHESSCVVYGMPRVVWEAGLSTGRAPIDQMSASVVSHL